LARNIELYELPFKKLQQGEIKPREYVEPNTIFNLVKLPW
jgi:hypothetical protein